MTEAVSGFSKLSKHEKINLIVDKCFSGSDRIKSQILSFWHENEPTQKVFDDFSENTLTNFYAPYGVVPNLLLNGKIHFAPMVIEESSVVAAASKAAKFWLTRGGFKATTISMHKEGQVHFIWNGDTEKLSKFFNEKKEELAMCARTFLQNMEKRGGGLIDIKLNDLTSELDGLYQLHGTFNTCDAMGANLINSILEAWGKLWEKMISKEFSGKSANVNIVMCILSNYTPNCRVRVEVKCPIEDLGVFEGGMDGQTFAEKFKLAVDISKADVYRATTHNKGIFNGVDAVVLATGNDFRAVEACGHTYAARDGKYRGLSDVEIKDGIFHFWLELPMALGTVGGLTSLHPMAKLSLDLLGRPSAEQLMGVAVCVGLAQNFAALRSLVTSGIQVGHMKMHLMNILNQLEANESERNTAADYFKDEVISFTAVQQFLGKMRNIH